jgi:hypothetical protein
VSCHDGHGGLGLEPQLSTRGISLGQTGLTECGSAQAFGVNPSCLPAATGAQTAIAYGSLIEGISSSAFSLSFAFPFGPRLDYLGHEILGRRYGFGVSIDHKGFELSQGSGWSMETISVGFGYRIAPYVSVGILSKMLFSTSDLDSAGVRAYGIDVGTQLELSPGVKVGLALRNLGAAAAWDDAADERPPVILSLGGTFIFPKRIRADIAFTASSANAAKTGIGVEVPLRATGFDLRGGYIHHSGDYDRDVPTAGFGFRHLGYAFDYAACFDDDKAFGITHHFSLKYHLP